MRSASPPQLTDEAFTLRRRPASEKLLDQGFQLLTLALASFVAILLLAIVLTVFQGSREAISTFGSRFITTSSWDPVNNQYGAFVAIYGTLVTALLSLLIAVPLGVGTAIFITEDLIPTPLRNAIGLMVELLAAAQLAHQQLLVAAEPHHRGCGPAALGIGDHHRPTAFKHRHHRIGRAQIDADDSAHAAAFL